MKTIYESNADMAAQLEAYKEREQALTQREKDCQAAEERLRSQQEEVAQQTRQLQEQTQRALEEQQRQLDARYTPMTPTAAVAIIARATGPTDVLVEELTAHRTWAAACALGWRR